MQIDNSNTEETIFTQDGRWIPKSEFEREQKESEVVEEPLPFKPKLSYPQNWKAYNEAQTSEKHFIQKILDELLSQLEQPTQTTGRPSVPLRDQIFAMCVHQYVRLSSRRTTCDLEEAHSKHYLFSKLHFSTLLKFYNNQQLTFLLKQLIEQSATPLSMVENHFAIDASGFSTSVFKRWFDEKYGKDKNIRLWKKCHITCGAKTNIITAVNISPGYEHDINHFPDLLKRTIKNFNVEQVSADKAYSSRNNIALINKYGALPLIPFKKNTNGKSRGCMFWRKAWLFFSENQEEFSKYYHLRSNVETVFSMIKRKLGHNLRTKKDVSQTNEILVKCLVHNLCVLCQEFFELDLDIEFNDKTNLSTN